MDTFSMTVEEFKKYSNTKQFQDNLSFDEKFDKVWIRLTPDNRRELVKITRENSLEMILQSTRLQSHICTIFKESTYITLDIRKIVKQIISNDDGIDLIYIG